MCGRIIIVKKKRRIAIRHPTESRGDVIMSDLTLKAKSSNKYAPNKTYFQLTSLANNTFRLKSKVEPVTDT